MGNEDERLGLADWLAALRAELAKAQRAGANEDLRFRVGEAELELEVVTAREGEGRAGIRFWVVELGAGAKGSYETSQRLRLTLTPRTAAGEEVDVGDAETRPTR